MYHAEGLNCIGQHKGEGSRKPTADACLGMVPLLQRCVCCQCELHAAWMPGGDDCVDVGTAEGLVRFQYFRSQAACLWCSFENLPVVWIVIGDNEGGARFEPTGKHKLGLDICLLCLMELHVLVGKSRKDSSAEGNACQAVVFRA